MRVGTRRSPAVTKATTTRTIERRWYPGLPALLAVSCAGVWSCAAPPRAAPAPVPTQAPLAPVLHRGPLSDFVPAAGLRWLALVKPREILADPELGPAIAEIVSNRRLDAFAESSGVDLRQVTHAAVAGFPYATLYLAEVPDGEAAAAREHFSERLLAGAVTKQPRANLLRITGVVGQTPETLLTVEDRVLAVAVGDPLLAKIAEAYAEERLKNSPSALRGSALSTLPDLTSGNAVALFAPGPFADEWRRAAGGLLESTVAVGVALRPIGHGKIAATLCLSGAWQESADAAVSRLATAWTAFAQSSAGHLFALSPNAEVKASPDLLTLNVEIEIEPLLRGLKAAVLSDISELLQVQGKTQQRAPDLAPNATP
jgi:hypothetical protein